MKKILVIGAGEIQVPIIKKVKELGFIAVVTDGASDAPGLSYADYPLIISTIDQEGTLAAAIEHKVDGILTTSDYPVRTVAYVGEQLNLPVLSQAAAIICTDKYKQRALLTANGLLSPRYLKIHGNESINLNIELNKFTFPLIVKPIDSSASRGVSKVTNIDELKWAIDSAIQYSKNGDALIEEYVDGPEFSVECLTQGGETHVVTITEKSTNQDDSIFFVEKRHIIPADLDLSASKAIESFVKHIVKLIGLNNSSSHIELKLTKEGPVLIELAARLGGDYITSDLVPLATGVDMLANIIHLALGESICVQKKFNKFAGIQFIDASNYQKAEQYIQNNKNKIVSMNLKPFKETVLKSSLDRLGYVIVECSTRDKLLSILNFQEN